MLHFLSAYHLYVIKQFKRSCRLFVLLGVTIKLHATPCMVDLINCVALNNINLRRVRLCYEHEHCKCKRGNITVFNLLNLSVLL